jgi:ribosomal protein L29
MIKKDEDLEAMKKNLKTTSKAEIDIEIKTYKDELLRLR